MTSEAIVRRVERVVFKHRAKVTAGYFCAAIAIVLAYMDRETPTSAPIDTPASLSEGQEPRDHYRGLPPPEFRGEWAGVVRFVDDVDTYCPSGKAYACWNGREIIMPNPCTPDPVASVGWYYADGSLKMLKSAYSWSVEEYRTTMCHEIGHANGWPGNHWIASETEIELIVGEMLDELYERDQTYGAIPREHLVGWRAYGIKGEAAVARMLADRTVSEDRFNDTYSEIRLTRCKYWTMREEREGDGAAKMKSHCPDA